jgi:hypothetical protein
MRYDFETTGFISGNSSIVQYLTSIDQKPSVSGSFYYNSAAPQVTLSSNYGYGDFVVYGARTTDPGRQSITNLIGSLSSGVFQFFDPVGSVSLSNDSPNYPGYTPPTDRVSINFEPVPFYRNNYIEPNDLARQDLSGFLIIGYTLANVRLFWFSGIYPYGVESPEFLSSNDAPDRLPDIRGRLALDFYVTSDSSREYSYSNTVFFDGLFVRSSDIPVPATLALLGLGLVGIGVERRKQA